VALFIYVGLGMDTGRTGDSTTIAGIGGKEDSMLLGLRFIIARDLRDHLTSSRYVIVSVLCIILCISSMSLMYNDLSIRQKRFAMHKSIRGVRAMSDDVPVVARRPQPLSIFAKGVEEHAGRPVYFSGGQPQDEPVGELFDSYGEEHHLFDLSTVPDFAYVIRTAFSILALFLAFDAVCGEREAGVLRLLCAYPVKRTTVIIGKWIGTYCSFLIGFAPALVIMLLWLTISPPAEFSSEHWVRLIGILLLSFLYISIFFSLGLLVSSLTSRSATALVLVLFVWMIWIVGIPRLGITASRAIRPVKPVFTFWLEKRSTRQGTIEEDMERLWGMDDAYIAKVNSQADLGMHLSRLSPLSSYVYGCTALASTGIHDIQDYRYRVAFWDRACRRGRESEFRDTSLSLGESLNDVWLDLALMIIWNTILGLFAIVAFVRYDVR
jgi:ABC-type transport system involved in multi-copper enzyme maturation permease subunit